MTNIELIQTLNQQKHLTFEQWTQLIGTFTEREQAYAADLAREISLARFGNKIFFRGIIEFTNYCKNDCLYCGIRRSSGASRYRLSKEDILLSCEDGYRAGFRTFVLQGGEDPWFSDERMEEIVRAIREGYPDCAITLSLGERSRESYQRLFDAGADRYLLRHETADKQHYESLHPPEISFENRMRCLYDLRDIGYQTGCGMMVGTPGQRPEHLASDMLFMCGFRPQMIGTGPFLPQRGCDAHADVAVPHHAARRAAARHHGAGHAGRRGPQARRFGGGKRDYAQPVAACGAPEVYAV